MYHFDLNKLPEYYLHFVAISSFVANFLAVVERAINLNFPNSRAAHLFKFLNDLVSGFGALNLRDRIVNGSKEKGLAAANNG